MYVIIFFNITRRFFKERFFSDHIMATLFILENEFLGTWYVGKIKTKMGSKGVPVYRSLTQDDLTDKLYKKYSGYDNPGLNLMFLNEHKTTCHGLGRWLSRLEYEIKRNPEKYYNVEKLLKAGWCHYDTMEYSSIHVLNIPEIKLNEVYIDLKRNWGTPDDTFKYRSDYKLKTCLNNTPVTYKERYQNYKQNTEYLYKKARQDIICRINKGFIPKKKTLEKYNLSVPLSNSKNR